MLDVSSLLHLMAMILIEVIVTWIVGELDGLNSLTVRPIPAAYPV